jgi:hypothetical protein
MHASSLVKEAEVRCEESDDSIIYEYAGTQQPGPTTLMRLPAARCRRPMSVVLPLSHGLGWGI